ncbi:hypothetical protein Tco_0603138 [Tanacetum coccineum]
MNFSMIENRTYPIFMSLVLSAIPLMTVKTLPMFDEYLNPPSCVDPQVPAVIAPEPAVSTEPDHDIEVAHMDNNPYVDFPIPEPSSEESFTQVVIPNNKFTKGIVDPTLFFRREGKDILLMSMKGKLSFFLGLQISQSPRGIFLNQSKYALESLKKYGMETCDPVDTPMVEKSKLDEDLQGKAVDPTRYREMIGTLMYLTSSRPDLVFVVFMCARYQAKPTEKHLLRLSESFDT